MPTDIRIEGAREAQRAIRRFPNRIEAAARRASRRTSVAARARATKEIRGDYFIRARDLKRFMRLHQRGARGEIVVDGKALPLILFGARDLRRSGRGVSFRVRRRGGRQYLPNAFIADSPYGPKRVLQRTGESRTMKSGRYQGKRREAVREMFTLSAPAMFENELPVVQPFAEARLEREINQQIDFELRRWGGRRR